MRKFFLMISIILNVVMSYGAINISPVDYDIDLLNEKKKVYTLTNVGNTEALYTVELEKGYSLGKFLSYKKNKFKLSPGEKKEIVLEINKNIKNISNQEYKTKLYILEKQQVKNINYEINTILNLYGYVSELKEEFLLNFYEKKGDILVGEIKNTSLRKIDVFLKLLDKDNNILNTKKIRVLKDKKFNLFELGIVEELNKTKKIIIESKDMKIEREI